MRSAVAGRRSVILGVASWLALGVAGQQTTPQSAPPKPPEAKPPVKRVRADLAGFELAPGASKPSTQVGGGTRQLAEGDPVPLAPVVGRCYTATPVFAWSHASQARTFEFRLLDEAGAIVHRATVTGRQFGYPADAPPLQPGATYRWTVQPESTMLGGPSAKATVLRLPAAELDAVSQQLAHPAAGGEAGEWRAQVFTDRRLWYDAVAAWSELIQRLPARADLREKRGQIYDQLPATEHLADEDFAAAERLRAGARF
jgi:uncharacterized protein DUF928